MSAELQPIDRNQLESVLGEMLPHPIEQSRPTPDSVRYLGGEPTEVVVDISQQTIVVAEYAASTANSSSPQMQLLTLGQINWPLLPAWTTRRILGELTAAASQSRRSKYRECIRCKKSFPPEVLTSDSTCPACEASDEGVVY